MQRIGSGLVTLVAVGLAMSACRHAPTKPLPPVRPEAIERFEAGERYRRVGLEGRALEAYRAAIVADPVCVAAQREYQNIRRSRCEERDVLEEYRAHVRDEPNNAAWHYLLGRLLVDGDEQRNEFEESVRLDPTFFWGHYGLAFQAEARGDVDGARREYDAAIQCDPQTIVARLRLGDLERRAHRPDNAEAHYATLIAIHPDDPDGYLGLAILREDQRKGGDALAACREAIRRHPADLAAQGLFRSLLAEHGTQAAFRDALDLLEGTEPQAPPTASFEFTRAICHRGVGEFFPAIASFDRAVTLGASALSAAAPLRLLHVAIGDPAAALRDFDAVAPRAILLDPQNAVRDRYQELIAATEAADRNGSDPDAARRLADAYAGVGWIAEAIHQFERALYLRPDDPRALAGLDRTVRHERFVRRLRDLVVEGYRAAGDSGRETPFSGSLGEALAAIEDLGRSVLGRDLSSPRRLRSYSFIGTQLEPSIATDDALAAYLREWNQYLLLGRRAGAPTEALLMQRLAVYPGRSREIAGEPFDFDEVIGGGASIPSFREYQGATVGGVTFEGMFAINLDTVLSWQERARSANTKLQRRAESLLAEPADPAPTESDRRRIGQTYCLEEKLYLRAYRDFLDRAIDSTEDWRCFLSVVETHEMGHLLQTRRFLPITSHPLRALGLLVGSGFSGSRIESSLEENAELNALVQSDSPWCSLAEIVSFLPHTDDVLPHSVGYARLLRAFVAEIATHGDRYPSIDSTHNVLQQLHRLSADEIRRAGREVARERGL
ncbi:MAG: tetratricopeptide repeat protein [Planctomycetes bacterium]|nr:tetratricopeptide repeat protein [Planctomycetota bacterium]